MLISEIHGQVISAVSKVESMQLTIREMQAIQSDIQSTFGEIIKKMQTLKLYLNEKANCETLTETADKFEKQNESLRQYC